MPLKRKKNDTIRNIFIWILVAVLLAMMIISFAPVQHMNEIVVFP